MAKVVEYPLIAIIRGDHVDAGTGFFVEEDDGEVIAGPFHSPEMAEDWIESEC